MSTWDQIKDSSSIQSTIFTLITLGTLVHLLIDAFTSKYLEKEQGSHMVAVYIIGSFFSFVVGYIIFGGMKKVMNSYPWDSNIKNIILWVILFGLIFVLSFLFYINNTLILVSVLGSLIFIFSNKEYTYDSFSIGNTIKNSLTRST